MIQITEKIPETCAYCERKAIYLFEKIGFFGVSSRFLCKNHQLTLTKVGWREFKRIMNPMKALDNVIKRLK